MNHLALPMNQQRKYLNHRKSESQDVPSNLCSITNFVSLNQRNNQSSMMKTSTTTNKLCGSDTKQNWRVKESLVHSDAKQRCMSKASSRSQCIIRSSQRGDALRSCITKWCIVMTVASAAAANTIKVRAIWSINIIFHVQPLLWNYCKKVNFVFKIIVENFIKPVQNSKLYTSNY